MTRHDKWYVSVLLVAFGFPLLVGLLLERMGGVDPLGYQSTAGFRIFTWIATLAVGGFLIATSIINYRRKRLLVQDEGAYEAKAGPTGVHFPVLARAMQTPVGAVIVLALNSVVVLGAAWAFSYIGVGGLLVLLGLRSWVVAS